MKVIIIGATGLTGSCLVEFLLQDFRIEQVIVVARRSTNIKHQKLIEKIIDFENLNQLSFDANIAISCLGTTIKNAGSKEKFYQTDFTYNFEFAKVCLKNDLQSFILMSSLGADASSKIFYSATKGQLEKAIMDLNFKHLTILQPSLLEGNRKEMRSGEKIARVMMKIFNPFFVGNLRKYRSIRIEDVARCIQAQLFRTEFGTKIIVSNLITEIAKTLYLK